MDGYRFPFEKLEAWQDARKLVKSAYKLTQGFPGEERYGLSSQMNRAAVSVASNLAEGSSRTSLRDQSHFSQMAYSSLMEFACQVTVAADLGFASAGSEQSLRSDINALANKINALRISQLSRAKK